MSGPGWGGPGWSGPGSGGPGPLLDAIDFAAHAHRHQRRKGAMAVPYINHCVGVATRLARCGVAELAVLQAAILHDVVEDTEVTLAEVAARFGAEVAGLVGEVTDDKSLEYAARKQAQIDHAAHKSPGAACIKIADKACNLDDLVSDPPSWPPARLQAYVVWAAQVIAQLPAVPSALAADCAASLARAQHHFGVPPSAD